MCQGFGEVGYSALVKIFQASSRIFKVLKDLHKDLHEDLHEDLNEDPQGSFIFLPRSLRIFADL